MPPSPLHIRKEPPPKPVHVPRAVFVLTIWVLWVGIYGIFETWHNIPIIEDAIATSLPPGFINIPADSMLRYAIMGYIVIAIMSGWIVINIGAGKYWARNSFIWSFVFQGIVTLAPPYHPLIEYFGDIPDLGLQLYAATLLYSEQSSKWFNYKDAIDAD